MLIVEHEFATIAFTKRQFSLHGPLNFNEVILRLE